MTTKWQELIAHKVVLLDGSTGTRLQQLGMPVGVSPEAYCLEHPEIIRTVQQEYIAAGADIIYTPTFGANRVKLGHYGLAAKTAEMNRRLAENSLGLAHPQGKLVAGDVGPTGVFFQPFGETPFELGIEIYTEQVRALATAGVDLIVIETQIDLQEARIALLAAKEATDLPVVVFMTFDEGQRTLTGSDPLACLTVLQSLGADGFGINCSTGPEQILPLVEQIRPFAAIPLLVKPNAGLPVIHKGKTVFPMRADEFASYAQRFCALGVSALGGCCGTTPTHIQQVAAAIASQKPPAAGPGGPPLVLASPRKTLVVSANSGEPVRVIGERINPTGKPRLQAELKAGKLDQVRALAREQEAAGADVLDVNLGAPGIDERVLMLAALAELAVQSELPLCIDSSQPEVIEAALRFYPGRVLVNSLSGESAKLEKLLPILKKYGAACIVLPLDDRGIPEDPDERVRVLETLIAACEDAGVPRGQLVVDGLVLTISANPEHAQTTLKTLNYAARHLNLNTVIGLSNVSFGLPGREYLNGAFLAMAAVEGLSLVIANPADTVVMHSKTAADALTGRDPQGRLAIQRFASLKATGQAPAIARHTPHAPHARGGAPSTAPGSGPERIRDCVLKGEKEKLAAELKSALQEGSPVLELVERILIPAIQDVGEKFNQREYFLPQLIAAAEAMEAGMQFLRPQLEKTPRRPKGVGVLATVRGDVHDIGKKIVALILRNHGYRIVDLGKSVDEHTIVERAIAEEADFIGLSALMTSTMTEMEKVVCLARERCPGVKIMLGGAVVTQAYATEIRADGYAPDAGKSVTVIEGLLRPPKKSKKRTIRKKT